MNKSNISDEQFIEVLNRINLFIEEFPGGESYWIDPDGKEHSADMGYAIPFWEDVYDYLKDHAHEILK